MFLFPLIRKNGFRIKDALFHRLLLTCPQTSGKVPPWLDTTGTITTEFLLCLGCLVSLFILTTLSHFTAKETESEKNNVASKVHSQLGAQLGCELWSRLTTAFPLPDLSLEAWSLDVRSVHLWKSSAEPRQGVWEEGNAEDTAFKGRKGLGRKQQPERSGSERKAKETGCQSTKLPGVGRTRTPPSAQAVSN